MSATSRVDGRAPDAYTSTTPRMYADYRKRCIAHGEGDMPTSLREGVGE